MKKINIISQILLFCSMVFFFMVFPQAQAYFYLNDAVPQAIEHFSYRPSNHVAHQNNSYVDQSLEGKSFFKKLSSTSSSFHLFSHGKSGKLLLEGKWRGKEAIALWLRENQYLKNKTHLNIYGCHFAQGEKGRAAVEYLKAALGVSVAASDDVTGIDGDWDLEVGKSHSALAITSYPYNLQGYIECATILNNFSDENLNTHHAVVHNGYTYAAYRPDYSAGDVPYPVLGGGQPSSGLGREIYIAIFDSNCNHIFGSFIKGSGSEYLYGLKLDSDGNFIISGSTNSPDFFTTDGTTHSVGDDLFIMKFSPDGTLIFSTIFGGDGNDWGGPITYGVGNLLIEGNDIYVVGSADGTNFPTTTTGTPANEEGTFVRKYDGAGNLIYSTIFGGGGYSEPDAMTVRSGEIYVIGNFYDANFPSTDGSIGSGSYQFYFVKLDSLGEVGFAHILKDEDTEDIRSDEITLTSDDTGVYLGYAAADFKTTDFTEISMYAEAFRIAKYDASGNIIFVTGVGSMDSDSQYPILQAANNRLYLYGTTYTNEYYPYPVVNGVYGAGRRDVVLTSLDQNGNIIYSTHYGSEDSEYGSDNIYINGNNEVFIVENFIYSGNLPTTDGTTSGVNIVKFNADGSRCLSSAIPIINFAFDNMLNFDVIGDTIIIIGGVNTAGGDISTDGTTVETVHNSEDIFMLKYVLCPAPTPINSDTLSPSTQVVCQNALVSQIIGEQLVIDGASFPQIYTEGVLGNQADLVLAYQWQTADNASGPWTDLSEPLAKLKNYTPQPTTVDVYYRRLAKTTECCGSAVVSTSNVAAVLATGGIAPTVDAGGIFYSCSGATISLGGSPTATGGTAPYTYDWNEGSFSTANPSVAPTFRRVYTLEVADADGCIQTDQAIVEVYRVDAGSNRSICSGESRVIGGSPLAGVPVVASGDTPPVGEYSIAYDWSPKDGSLSCTDCPKPIASPTSTTTYTLQITINYPDGTDCQSSDMMTLSVSSATIPTETTIPDTVICLGDEIELGLVSPPISEATITAVSQNTTDGGFIATIANLTDGDFTTGGRTTDGSGNNITIDLGSIQTVNTVTLGQLGADTDYRFNIQRSTDNITFVNTGASTNGNMRAGALSTYKFTPADARYIRLRSTSFARDAAISEFQASYDLYTSIWTPGLYIATNGNSAIFDAGNLEMPEVNPITYTLSTTVENCTEYDQVTVAVIEARAGVDGCGPRMVGDRDRTPNIAETYSWVKITDPSITTGTGDFLDITNERLVPVSASVGGNVGYELTTSYTLNGSIGICKDTVIVPPSCGSGCLTVATTDGSCPSFDAGTPSLIATPLIGSAGEWTYSWTSDMGMVGLNQYNTQVVNLTDGVTRTYTVTITSLVDPSYTCTETIEANSASFSTPVFLVSDLSGCADVPINIGNPANNPGLTYEWSNANLLDDHTISNPQTISQSSTSFTVTVTDNVTGCKVVDNVALSIAQVANAGFDRNVCDNSTITLGSNPELPGYTYAWEPVGADWRNGTDENDAQPDAFVAISQDFYLKSRILMVLVLPEIPFR